MAARGWAKACEVRLAYATGEAAPVAIGFDTFGTGADPAPRFADLGLDLARAFRPRAINERLGLTRSIFRDTAIFTLYLAAPAGLAFKPAQQDQAMALASPHSP